MPNEAKQEVPSTAKVNTLTLGTLGAEQQSVSPEIQMN